MNHRPVSRTPVAVSGLVATLVGYLLVCTFWSPVIPTPAAVTLCAIALGAAWKAEGTLVGLAAALPVVTYATLDLHAPEFQWPVAIVAAYCCGYFVHLARRRQPNVTGDVLRTPVLMLTAIILASVIVELAAFEARLGGAAFRAALGRVLGPDFFIANSTLPGVHASTLLLEGLALAWAATVFARGSDRFRRALPRALVLGTTAAAAANLWRFVEVAARADAPLRTFAHLLRASRVNVHFGDLNAAGSCFVLVLCMAAALAWRRRGWTVTAALIAAALWASGSRVALLAGILAGTVAFAAPALSRFRPRDVIRAAVAAIILMAIALAAVQWLPERGNQKSASTAIEVRLELARTAGRMLAARPVFGIGPGEFYQRTAEFSSRRLITLFPVATNENAHNNFLQILAELGLTGFAAFAWILIIAARRAAALLRHTPRDGLSIGVIAGVVAFLLTCVGGHPLLIPEVAGVFWLSLGLLCGWGAAVDTRARSTPHPTALRRTAFAALIILVVTLPLRARQQVADTDLEHVGIGLTDWQEDDGGRRYREGRRSATVFVPAGAASVTIPLRAAVAGDALEVELRLDGRLVDAVRVVSDTWSDVLLVLPRGSQARYRPVQLHVTTDGTDTSTGLLLVGKVVPH